MKFFILLLSFSFISLQAEAPVAAKMIQVTDVNGETLAGVKIELMGTGKTFYTNLNGVCIVPQDLIQSVKWIKVECISYKSQQMPAYELNSKIILEFR